MRRVIPAASIPSPSSGTWTVGPLSVHMYGLMLLLAVAACTALTALRWVRGWAWRASLDGVNDKLPHEFDLVLRVAVWGTAGRGAASAEGPRPPRPPPPRPRGRGGGGPPRPRPPPPLNRPAEVGVR